MAKANLELINALQQTAKNLKAGATYAWGNHGACNCGNLLQTVTQLNRNEILAYAQQGTGEWTELATEYCGVTNAPVDLLVQKLKGLGLNNADIHDLEYLENKQVLNHLPGGFRWLQKNKKEDVVLYFETYASLLSNELLRKN